MIIRYENIKTYLNELENEGLIRLDAENEIYNLIEEIDALIEEVEDDDFLYDYLDVLEEKIENGKW